MATIAHPSRLAQWLKVARNPPQYLIASLLVTLGGFLNGLDSGAIGPVTVMPSFTATFGALSASLHGLVISSILLSATVASLFAGALSDSLGRPRVIAIGALVFAIGAALEAGAVTLGMLIAGRLIVGAGEGIFLSIIVVYVCEISPPNKRGPLTTMIQLLITLGLVIGYFSCYGSVRISSSLSWRLPLALHSGIAFFLAAASYFYLPQSPRWLALKDRKAEASEAWDRLGVSNAEREKDLLQNPVPIESAALTDSPTRPTVAVRTKLLDRATANLKEMMAIFRKDARKPMFLGVFLMSMQQLSGIDGVIYYAPLLFQQAGISSSEASFLASGISAILIFVFTILSVYLVDRWGRRASTIYGGVVIASCMILMGLLYATKSVHATYGGARWVVIITIFVFAIVYSMTWAIGMKLFASEIQPVATRASATSLGQSANCITNFFVAFITPVLLARSSSGIYFLFGGASFLTVAVCIMYMPETKGRDLEAIGEAFGLHKVKETPMIRGLRSLASWGGEKVGILRGPWGHVREVERHEFELEGR